jgi:hypothetical protein
MSLTVLYWNVARNSANVTQALENCGEVDVLALQELPVNEKTGSVQGPAGGHYHRVYVEGRAAIYVHKRHDIASWSQRGGKDWCNVQFGAGEQALTVWSIYSENTNTEWQTPLSELAEQDPQPGRHLVVGDMNLHHPAWDRAGRYETESETLIALSQRWGLELATPWGETTRFRHDQQDSTIDHAWASHDLRVRYEGDAGLTGSDHISQLVRVELAEGAQPLREPPAGWSWALLDKKAAAALAATTIKAIDPERIYGPDDLDLALENLFSQLTLVADGSTPRRKSQHGVGAPWFTRQVKEAIAEARTCQRRYLAARSQHNWAQLQRANQQKTREISRARTLHWRRGLAEASKEPKKLWKLAKWARSKSHTRPDDATMPTLGRREGEAPESQTHAEKAEVLSERFFPSPPADLSDLGGRHPLATNRVKFQIDRSVTTADTRRVLNETRPWKAPGTEDLLPTGFLKACGKPLVQALTTLINKSFEFAYYPQRLRRAGVVVLAKPGKTQAQKRTAGAYRPIALLSAVGKVFEKIVAERLADAAEAKQLLPKGQMGNRRGRSTELAIRVVTEAVFTAWGHGAVASLLQLDIKGAFDTVNHTRLLHILAEKGYPIWFVRWISSFLEDRSVRLHFDGATASPRTLTTGVPQGSPLSPILFLLYISTLYEELERDGLIIVGFADDTNLLVASRDVAENCRRLGRAYQTCEAWASRHGMVFEPGKSELIHFTREHAASQQRIRLGDAEVAPKESTRFLGVWLDRKLRWRAHLKKLQAKLATQTVALTRLAASAWGVSFEKAREVYTKVIRSAIAYGASVWHNPTASGGVAKGLARSLLAAQSKGLRAVAGAYKATPIHTLERETNVPPLDLYLNKRLADFEQRLEISGMAQLVRNSNAAIASWLRRRYPPQRRRRGTAARVPPPREAPGQSAKGWSDGWLGQETADEALAREWRARWSNTHLARRSRRGRREPDPADWRPFDETDDPGDHSFHRGFLKHESSVLVQMRTGKIGLLAFLHERQVPDVPTPRCPCDTGARQTAFHIVAECSQYQHDRRRLAAALGASMPRTCHDFAELLYRPREALILSRWMLSTGVLSEYRLARCVHPDRTLDPPPERPPRASGNPPGGRHGVRSIALEEGSQLLSFLLSHPEL